MWLVCGCCGCVAVVVVVVAVVGLWLLFVVGLGFCFVVLGFWVLVGFWFFGFLVQQVPRVGGAGVGGRDAPLAPPARCANSERNLCFTSCVGPRGHW